MSWLHTWVGLVLAVVLYFMFITGTVGYFNSEIDRWMMPERGVADKTVAQREMITNAIARLTAVAPNAKEWYVSLPRGRQQTHLEIYYQPQPGADGKEIEGKSDFLDTRTGAPLAETRQTGGGAALYAMHYSLHYIPYEVAIYIVGVATMFMLIAIVTGVVVHKKIFKDFFTFRPAKGQRSWLDAHNISSVMALPFMVMITYSGLIFYTYEYMPSVKAAIYGQGEQASKTFEREVYGDQFATLEAANVRVPLARLAPMIDVVEHTWGANAVRSLAVYLPGDANAKVRFDRLEPPTVTRTETNLMFNGATGMALPHGTRVQVAANKFADVMLALHEGHFASPLLRWLYFITGLLGAAMVATGTVLWVAKRRQQLKRDALPDVGLQLVERLNIGVIVGLPIGIAAYFWANRLLPLQMPDRAAWEMHVLFISWGICLVHGMLRPPQRGWIEQFGAAAVLYGLIPLLNRFTTSQHLGVSLTEGDWVLASVDLTLLVLGIVFGATALRLKRRTAIHKSAPSFGSKPANQFDVDTNKKQVVT